MTKTSNKESAEHFLNLIVGGDIDHAYEKYVSSTFRHHNPHFKGDIESLKTSMKEVANDNPNMTIKIHRSLEEGDFVAVHSQIGENKDDKGFAFVHIMKFEKGLITELWDVGQNVPDESRNEFGMF